MLFKIIASLFLFSFSPITASGLFVLKMNHPGAEPRSITSCRGVFKQ